MGTQEKTKAFPSRRDELETKGLNYWQSFAFVQHAPCNKLLARNYTSKTVTLCTNGLEHLSSFLCVLGTCCEEISKAFEAKGL